MAESDAVTWYRAAQQAQRDRAAKRVPKEPRNVRVVVANTLNRRLRRTAKKLGINMTEEEDD